MLTFVILTIIFAACAIIYGIIGAAKEPGSQTVNKPRPTVRVTVGTPEKDVPVRSLRYFCVKDKGYNVIRIVTSEGHRVGYIPRNMTDRIRDFATLPCTCFCYIGTNNGIYFSDCYISRI